MEIVRRRPDAALAAVTDEELNQAEDEGFLAGNAMYRGASDRSPKRDYDAPATRVFSGRSQIPSVRASWPLKKVSNLKT